MDRTDSRLALSPETASDDVASPLNAVPPSLLGPACETPPWEADPAREAGRQRHDAFTGARKQQYLRALAKTGCIRDACRITGISSSSVYNHQASDPDFARHCTLAVDMASTPIELTAYERAVVGQEEPVIRGGKVVGTRIKRSDYMLRVLLQGADPKKYGPRPGFTRKRLLKAERKQIEREVRAEMAEPKVSFDDAIQALDKSLRHLSERTDAKRREQGWTELRGDLWIPPGWTWTGEGDPVDALTDLGKKDDAVCNSSNSSTLPAPASPPLDDEANGADRRAGVPEGGTGREGASRVQCGGKAAAEVPGDTAPEAEDPHDPSFRRKPEPVTTEVRNPDPRCSSIPDQARDDDPSDIQTPSSRHPSY